jgi:hypothetical protein
MAAVGVAFLALRWTSPAEAEQLPTDVPPAEPAAVHLPITQVVLYSSGVAYVQREGTVEGNARLEMSFPVQNVNDLLKSMVLEDQGGGHVSVVSFDSHDPVEKTLKSFAVDLTGNPSVQQLLAQARGERVLVTFRTGPDGWVEGEGKILSLETRRVVAGSSKDTLTDVAVLNLSTAEGVCSIPLADIRRVRFQNPTYEAELQRALDVMARAHDVQKKTVTLTFAGQGKRPVRVGYIVESPVWRTSYRLVAGDGGKVLLQGWAVVENPSNEDWSNVRLALVSGRPISFKTDLYQPLYVNRPLVQSEGLALPLPTSHAAAVTASVGAAGASNGNAATPPACAAPAPVPPPAPQVPQFPAAQPQAQIVGVNPQQAVVAAVAAAQGSSFQYVIPHLVTLPRQKAALLPIVNKHIDGNKVSVYNAALGTPAGGVTACKPTVSYYSAVPGAAGSPLLGLRLKNTSGLHLTAGPVTVFDGPGYAGDAQLVETEPGESGLVTYAVDLACLVETAADQDVGREQTVRISGGVMSLTARLRERLTYRVKNRGRDDRVVWVEHPYRADFKLTTTEKLRERSHDVYRFEVKLQAGQATALTVEETKDVTTTVAALQAGPDFRNLLKEGLGSPQLRKALAKALDLEAKKVAAQQDLARRQQQLQDITQDQARLRANLKETPEAAAAYKRYLQKLDRQETEIETLQAQIKELQEAVQRLGRELEAYWNSVEVGPTTFTLPPGREQITGPRSLPVTPPVVN